MKFAEQWPNAPYKDSLAQSVLFDGGDAVE